VRQAHFQPPRQDVLRHPLPLFEILFGARNAARAHPQDPVVHLASIHATVCGILQRAASERRNRIRVRLVETAAEQFFRKDLRESAIARQCETRVRSEETRHGRGQSHVQAQNDHKFRPLSCGVDRSSHNDESSTRSRLNDT